MNLFENVLICPKCKAVLVLDCKMLKCENNHTYDIAKQGYVNLLPVNQKKSKHPGDDKTMLNARRSFLEHKFYDPLILKLVEIIKSNSSSEGLAKIKILDAGCGEGYYMSNISEQFKEGLDFFGFDISKHAIKMAANKYVEMCFFVASIKQIPIQTRSIDFIISIFSPFGNSEFDRVLKKDGRILMVSPNTNHLMGLTNIIYPKHNEHRSKIDDYSKELFSKNDEQTLSYDVSLTDSKDVMSLFMMTPYYYSTSKVKAQQLEGYNHLDVLIDFKITVLEKNAVY